MKKSLVYKRARRRVSMTQAEFAELLGVTPITVSRWETGRVTPGGTSARVLDALTGPNPESIVKALRKR